MENAKPEKSNDKWEIKGISSGLILAGLAIVITGISYILNMNFTYQWLVWIIGLAFIVVGLLTIEWPRGLKTKGILPEGIFRKLLILSIPLAFVVSSQVCGIGLRACNALCHITNTSLILLSAVVAFRLFRGQAIGVFLLPMIVIALVPHCVCHAPINTLWHSLLDGVAPTCEMMPLAASFFAVIALRGVRPQLTTTLVVVIFVVMVFIIVGGLLFGFPWQGCVDHPAMTS
jgi:hypothetical protein